MWRILKKIFLYLFVFQFVYIIALRWVNPPITITQLSNWISGNGLARDYVDYNEMSASVKLAVIAGEDQLFAEHNGFDMRSIRKAMKYNEKNPNKRRGASTISQQTAKNVFLWQGGGFFRKGLEVYFTFMIELFWPKERILEVYLNVAETGKGVFGVEAAARRYFNKSASQLTDTEAARIAAALPNPKRYTVKPLSNYVSKRSAKLLRQMNNLEGDPAIQKVIQAR
ncbi:MAG TPA: monofunctional biosynthetic peptidoglycan transglycosylase [Ferruginibacter sp.]|nr:monofunctional biosynthetic peptidoglycan transglycosylase [Chitinophagaceae bacterium]HML56734.1 monofunctional biosynthetic peptidoglycan transglycosylase [Ferruginibacter sp.]HRN92914.1 monofunctional biosynthetic peptidoglycan transglycosylase [Ferruginibacter sp.]HRO06481.1 monofunctional biosynthetic peptidoglycan transglycosylase [Ferruginibacter sp.]HRO96702.1 monofunctional biosynthetic peptidoglycan transglycosylase [Ferruginibacter sp.]